MNHDEKLDQALLMLAVGETSGFDKLATEAHLLVCPQCRARLSELGQASASFAASFSNTSKATPVTVTLHALQVKFAIYAAAIVALTSVTAGVVVHEHASQASPAPILRCLPGIPSDKCQ